MTRRSTETITVFAFLSLTTVPCRTRLGIFSSPLPARRLRGLGLRLLAQEGLDPCDVAPDGAHAGGVLQLTAGALEAQVERLLLQRHQVGLQLIVALNPQIFRLHDQSSYSSRATKRALIGSLAAASVNASTASGF